MLAKKRVLLLEEQRMVPLGPSLTSFILTVRPEEILLLGANASRTLERRLRRLRIKNRSKSEKRLGNSWYGGSSESEAHEERAGKAH